MKDDCPTQGWSITFIMATTELVTWLLGIGGYTGVIGSLAILYLYPTFPRNLLPFLMIAPLVSASAFYLFFQTLYLTLGFAVRVFESMLNENITIMLIATIFIGGETLFVSYIIYRYLFMRSPEEENVAADEVIDDAEGAENAETEEDEADIEAFSENEDDASEGDEETHTVDALNTAACVDCDNECTNCMPALIPADKSNTVMREDGVCSLNADITNTQAWKDLVTEVDANEKAWKNMVTEVDTKID